VAIIAGESEGAVILQEDQRAQGRVAESRSLLDGGERRLAGGVIVVGGSHGSVGIARSLGRRGVPVWVLNHDWSIQKASRYVQRSLRWPSSDTGRLAMIVELAQRYGLRDWTLFPAIDAEVEFVSRNWATLSEWFRLTTPAWPVTRWALDKRLTYQRCAALHIDHPWTRIPSSLEELSNIGCTFPAILKPAVRGKPNPFVQAKAWRVDDRRALLERFEAATLMVGPGAVVLQEMIPGGGEAQYSYAALCLEGKPVATLVGRRTRQYPIDFGYTSTFVETVDRPEIEEPAVRFLESIRYSGLVEIEFKYDRRDGRYKLLDVNPRVWTWHTLGRRAGVDFPYLMWLQAQGLLLPQMRARTGVRWILGARDLMAALLQIRQGTLRPSDYFRSLRPPLEFGLFSLDDPMPALAAIPKLVHRLWRGGIS
jgi:D-aspartate ligase